MLSIRKFELNRPQKRTISKTNINDDIDESWIQLINATSELNNNLFISNLGFS